MAVNLAWSHFSFRKGAQLEWRSKKIWTTLFQPIRVPVFDRRTKSTRVYDSSQVNDIRDGRVGEASEEEEEEVDDELELEDEDDDEVEESDELDDDEDDDEDDKVLDTRCRRTLERFESVSADSETGIGFAWLPALLFGAGSEKESAFERVPFCEI